MRDATVTDLDLQRAWDALHKPDWLPLHQAMKAAAQYKLVYGLALRLAQGERPQLSQPNLRGPNVNPDPTHARPPVPAGPALPRREAIFDNKRAASGERPDD